MCFRWAANFDFWEIYPIEFANIQNPLRFYIVLDIHTKIWPTALIFIWVFCALWFLFWGHFWWKFSWKNEFPQINPRSIWDGSWISRASKNIRLNALEASGTMKNIKILKKVIKSKINQENDEISWIIDPLKVTRSRNPTVRLSWDIFSTPDHVILIWNHTGFAQNYWSRCLKALINIKGRFFQEDFGQKMMFPKSITLGRSWDL